MKILVVDDDADIAAVIARIIRHLKHHDVTVCADPSVALVHHIHEPYDMVLADYHMPPITGLALLTEFAVHNPECFRVILTATVIGQKLRRAVETGVIHRVVQKPATVAEINALLLVAEAH